MRYSFKTLSSEVGIDRLETLESSAYSFLQTEISFSRLWVKNLIKGWQLR